MSPSFHGQKVSASQSVSLALTHLVGQQDEPDGGGEYVGNKQIDVDCVAKTAQIPGRKKTRGVVGVIQNLPSRLH